jgi:sulfonate transport system permease protein
MAMAGHASRDRITPWILPIVLIAIWELAARQGWITQRLLPAPSDVAMAFWDRLWDGSLIKDCLTSSERALEGLAIGGLLGLILGFINGLWQSAEQATDTTLQMLRNIPPLAIIPMVILWFGIGEEAKIFLVAYGVLFPIYLNTYHGVRNVDPALVEMAQVYGLSRYEILTRVIFPGALPSILVGLRFALGFMWLILIVSETISASSGIGFMTMNAREFMQTDIILLGILLYTLLGKLADVFTRLLERWLLSWNPAFQAKGATA